MHLQKRKLSEPLFTTRSGIEVKRMAEVADQYNILVKFNRSGLIKLNGQQITHQEYNRLLVKLQVEYPGSCVYAEAQQYVFVYPKSEEEHSC